MNEGGSSLDFLSLLRSQSLADAVDDLDLNLGIPWPVLHQAAGDVLGWEHSSHELLSGVEVTDFSETISGEVFFELFRR